MPGFLAVQRSGWPAIFILPRQRHRQLPLQTQREHIPPHHGPPPFSPGLHADPTRSIRATLPRDEPRLWR